MKINRFIGRSVNGYLNFNIPFVDQVTFVTGINGSGKTSALNSIAALLLPKLDYLAGEYFDEISIEISHNAEDVCLSATKRDSATELRCTRYPDSTFPFVGFDPPDSLPPLQAQEYEQDYYRGILARNEDNPILSYIDSLPTPMYLGLDRRSLSLGRDRARYRHRPMGRPHKGPNIFERSLDAGLREALSFARDRIQADRRQESSLDAQFRETLVLALIDFPPISLSGELQRPSAAELRRFEETKTNLRRLPALLNVDQETISSKIDPVINFLDQTLTKIRRKKVAPDDIAKKDAPDEFEFALFEWTFNKTNIDKLSALSELISKYNSNVSVIRSHTNEYLETVNGFMRDTGKRIIFNSAGELRFLFDTNDDEMAERDLNTLSSGEIQLVVILTHLYFNPEVERANVFIIDEPELSLHVQWQEKFVAGITEASKETQFILATHSPTIILDRTANCVDISRT